MKRITLLIGWVAAVLLSTMLISFVHSAMVQQELLMLGVQISPMLRLETAMRDLAGLLPALGAVVATGFLIAFPAAALASRRAPGWLAAIGYPIAGAIAVGAMLALMQAWFNTTPIAGARTLPGMLLMIASGALGGTLFKGLVARR